MRNCSYQGTGGYAWKAHFFSRWNILRDDDHSCQNLRNYLHQMNISTVRSVLRLASHTTRLMIERWTLYLIIIKIALCHLLQKFSL
jgi:hypothetical protein